MGNRAIIKPIDSNIGVYLHWNGGPSSVEAFLTYCKLRQFRDFGGKHQDGYGIARFVQIVANFFGGGISIGVEILPDNIEDAVKDYWLDNGIYVVDGWDVVDHIGSEPYPDDYNIQQFLLDIDEAQPEKERLGKDYILAKEILPSALKIGDTIAICSSEGDTKVITYEVIGFGDNEPVSGNNVNGVPYIDRFGKPGEYHKSIYNYIFNPVRRL